MNMICHRADTRDDTGIEASDEEPTAIYLRRTPVGMTLGWVAAALIVIFVIASTLLACVLYPLIWLSIKSGLLLRRRSALIPETGQKTTRRFRFSDLVPGSN